MPKIREISIEGLFGLYDHTLNLREDPPITIVAGPNGIGKTTLLRLCTALLEGTYRELARIVFTRLDIVSTDGVRLSALPQGSGGDDGDMMEILLRQERPGVKKPDETTLRIPHATLAEVPLPPYIEPRDAGVYIDTRDGEILITEEVIARYGRPGARIVPLEPPKWFDRRRWEVDFIETKRLDTVMTSRRHRQGIAQAPIKRYLEAVADALENARRESARISQASTRSVARRLLTEYSRKTVRPDQLRARYARVGERASILTENGLLSDSLEVLPEGKLNPTEKRFLELFLDDFEAKLQPLDPVSAKIDQLRSIIGPKFLNKQLMIDLRGVKFLAEPEGSEIDPASLSSGEQHELALISRLLFSDVPGTTVLIDEPELSLHISWQHEMIEDLEEIARVANLSFVLATHSTAIINGRWDLVEELGPLEEQMADLSASKKPVSNESDPR